MKKQKNAPESDPLPHQARKAYRSLGDAPRFGQKGSVRSIWSGSSGVSHSSEGWHEIGHCSYCSSRRVQPGKWRRTVGGANLNFRKSEQVAASSLPFLLSPGPAQQRVRVPETFRKPGRNNNQFSIWFFHGKPQCCGNSCGLGVHQPEFRS